MRNKRNIFIKTLLFWGFLKDFNNYKKLSNDTNKFTQFANFTREHNILKLSHKNSSYGSLENSNTFHSGSLGII